MLPSGRYPTNREQDPTGLLPWRLQARFLDSVESVSFSSRQEAIEHAQALLRDYDSAVGLTLIDPRGLTETLQDSPFTVRDGTH